MPCLDILCVHPPHLEAVVHPTGDDPCPVQVEVGAEDLVPVALHAAEYCDIVLSLKEAVNLEIKWTIRRFTPEIVLKLTAFP